MKLEVRVWPTPDAFLANLGAVDETAACVIYGMAHTWRQRPKAFKAGTPLLTATVDGKPVAAAIQASVGKVVFSAGPTEAILALARWWEAEGRRPAAAVVPETARDALLALWPGRPTLEHTLYKIEALPPLPAVTGLLRRARPAETDWLIEWVTAFNRDARLPDDPRPQVIVEAKVVAGHLFVWEDGEPRAIAALAGPSPRAIRINTVYTPDRFRGRGYASAAVATLTRLELQAGRKLVQLFADRSLAHTNRMYRKIGYQPTGDFADLELEEP